jgi:outer membrane protein
MCPLHSRVGRVVIIIAQEEKFTQVFTLDANQLAYVDPVYGNTLKSAIKLGWDID